MHTQAKSIKIKNILKNISDFTYRNCWKIAI